MLVTKRKVRGTLYQQTNVAQFYEQIQNKSNNTNTNTNNTDNSDNSDKNRNVDILNDEKSK